MTFEGFKDKVFSLGKKKGVEVQLRYRENREFNIRLANGELDQYTDASKFSVTVEVLKDGKLGRYRTESFEDPERCLEEALTNLEVIDSEEKEYFYEGGVYPRMEIFFGEFEKLSVREKMKMVEIAYRSALEKDGIFMVPLVLYNETTNRTVIANTLGLNVESKRDGGIIFAMALAKDVNPRSGVWVEVGVSPSDLKPEEVGRKAAEEALSYVGARKLKSGKYPAVLRNNVLTELFEMFFPMVSAEHVQKNMSPLKGKLGQKIAADRVTIWDLPFYPKSLNNAPFDDEGVPTREKRVVDRGVLTTYLHNLKTAKKEGKEPTGNAIDGRISPVNLVLEPGEELFEDLLKILRRGILITEIEGMHAGANSVSGEFSLFAKGLWVEDGTPAHAVEEITISGNFLELLKRVVAVGKDLRISTGRAICPSVLVEALDIAGE